MMLRDRVDIELIEYENECERYDDSNDRANAADTANKDEIERDVPTYAEQDRMIAAHNQRVLSEVSAWCARPVRSPESARLLAAAEAQIQRQYGRKTA